MAFAAFWTLWAAVTTYGNLHADGTSLAVLFSAMAVLGVMAAAVPGIYGEHARAFAMAYVIGRIIIARPWTRTSVVVDLPIVQTSFGVLPWIVSLWVDGDGRYVLWALGIAMDLAALVTKSGEKIVVESQQRLDRVIAHRGKQVERAAAKGFDLSDRQGRDPRPMPTTITALKGDSAHLSERMGLFVLIILGEAIIQLTASAEASDHWSRALLVAAMGAFALVCGLFLVGVVRGTAGLAFLETGRLPSRALWVSHLVVSMALVTLGASVGRLLEEPQRADRLAHCGDARCRARGVRARQRHRAPRPGGRRAPCDCIRSDRSDGACGRDRRALLRLAHCKRDRLDLCGWRRRSGTSRRPARHGAEPKTANLIAARTNHSVGQFRLGKRSRFVAFFEAYRGVTGASRKRVSS